MSPIAVFYHCQVFNNKRVAGASPTLSQNAVDIITSQMIELNAYELPETATDVFIGIAGGQESAKVVRPLAHKKSQLMLFGLDAKSETPTIVKLQEYARKHPEHFILYFHSKGASHVDVEYLKFVTRWRWCMMQNLVIQWRKCVAELESGYDSVGCHWMTNMSPPSDKDSIWGGNFWWVKASFLNILEPITERPLIKEHGINAPIARMESERFLGAGPRLPVIKDYHINGIGSCP